MKILIFLALIPLALCGINILLSVAFAIFGLIVLPFATVYNWLEEKLTRGKNE